MDNVSYDQLQVTAESLGDAANYLKESDNAVLQMFGTEIVGVELPASVELTVADDRARNPGRPGVRRSQAGDARDRPRSPGAACSSTKVTA